MSGRDGVTIGLGLLVLVGVASLAFPRPGRTTPGWVAQVVAGLACGIVGAVIVSAHYVDLVPDQLETSGWEIGVLVLLALLIASAHAVRRLRLRHPPSSRRSPGAERPSTSRMHRGP